MALEEEWRSVEPWCRGVADACSEPVLIVDDQRCVRLVNAAARRAWAGVAEGWVGTPLTTLVPAFDECWVGASAEQPRRCALVGADPCEQVAVVRVSRVGPSGAFLAITLGGAFPRPEPLSDLGPEEGFDFRSLAESVPHMVWTCEPEGPCDYLSPQWVEYTGVPEAKQLGYGWLNQLHPEDAQETQRRWGEAAAAGAPLDTEFRIRRHDGSFRWFKTRAVPIRDSAGTLVKWYGTNTDIQDLRNAQQATQRLNEQLERHVRARTRELSTARGELEALALQLQTAQRVARLGSWQFDVASGDVAWSEELFRVFGLDPREAPPNYADQEKLFTPESFGRLREALSRAVETGEGYELVLEAIRPDGEVRSAVARAETMLDSSGKVTQLVGTFQDVTASEAARRKLGQLSERLQIATSAAHMGVWDWDVEGDVLLWDGTMFRLYGVPESSFGGAYEAWRNAIHPDDLAPTEAALRRAVEGPDEFRMDFRIRTPEGAVKYIRAAATAHRHADTGRALRMVGVNWDITPQRVAEQALRNSRGLMQGLLEHAGSCFIATDAEGTVTLFNRAAERLLGYTAAEVVGRATPMIFHDPFEVEARRDELAGEIGRPVESLFDVFVHKPREQNRPEARQWTYVAKDGRRLPVLLTVSCLRGDDGEVVAYLGVAVDLSKQKRHESQLMALNELLEERTAQAEGANAAKSAFVANVSHEIRTPLGAITGTSYLLSKTPLSPEQDGLLRTIDRSAKTLLGMINDILDLSKMEAGQLTLEPTRFELMQCVDELAGLMAGVAFDKQVELVIDVDPELPGSFYGDRGRLMQVLSNLTGNAIKFTDEGSVVATLKRLRSEANRTWLRIEVRDTGPGVHPDMLPHLFERFSHADVSQGRRAGGTGLGLAIVKELSALMGGQVGVESELGRGSLFWSEVPLEHVAEDELSDDKTARLRVLIVDDHEGQRLALKATGARFGWAVETASSGEEALRRLQSAERGVSPFDVLILDWKMPGLDGLQTVAAIQRHQGVQGERPVVVMTTAYDLNALRAHPQTALVDAILGKPVAPTQLFDAVASVVAPRLELGRGSGGGGVGMESMQRLAGVRVLVVDDSEVNRDIARRILELEGASVDLAADGRKAVERVKHVTDPYDVALMDIQMPEMDGIEAVRAIRALDGGRELPVIALTAGAMADDRERAMDAGMNDFVSKPFDPNTLVNNVRQHAERYRGAFIPLVKGAAYTPEAANWPSIEGIDAQDAFVRLGADEALFRTLLRKLLVELDEIVDAVVPDNDVADLESLASAMHRLRGMAGNLGARPLHRRARDVELAARGGDAAVVAGPLAALVDEAKRLRDSAAAVDLERRPTPLVPGADVSLQSFLAQLRDRDLEALESHARLAPQLREWLGDDHHGALEQAMERLDFDAALAVLDQMGGREGPLGAAG